MLVTPSWADLCAGERARLGYFRLREGDPGGVVARRSPLSMERLSPSGRGVPSRDPPNPLFCRGKIKGHYYNYIITKRSLKLTLVPATLPSISLCLHPTTNVLTATEHYNFMSLPKTEQLLLIVYNTIYKKNV